VSAKRYALLRLDPQGQPRLAWNSDGVDQDEYAETLTDWSEHGLGVFLDPSTEAGSASPRDAQRRRLWMRQAWEWVLGRELGLDVRNPSWLDRYALTQFSVARPQQLRWFAGRDQSRPLPERMRPGSFGLLAHVHGFLSGLAAKMRPAAPFEPTAGLWDQLDWYDRQTGKRLRLTTVDPGHEPDRFVADHERGAVRAKTMLDILATYAHRPEYKSIPPDGSQPNGRARGLLRRRPIESTPAVTSLAGKEGNRLLERAIGQLQGDDPSTYRAQYGARADLWSELIAPATRRLGVAAVAKSAGLHRRSVERALSGVSRPREGILLRWVAAIARIARAELTARGMAAPEDQLAAVQAFIDLGPGGRRRCQCGCGRELIGNQIRWATEACRKRAGRRAT
jgi:hypothetical protein